MDHYDSIMKRALLFVSLLLFAHASYATTAILGQPCADPAVQNDRSVELKRILESDQADRDWLKNLTPGERPAQKLLDSMNRNDLRRRMRVGEIFGEGCLKSAADYNSAFFVYQHGNTSGHYFQAFIWAKESLNLGNPNVKGEVAMAVDRYLVSTGRQQLFGTQASQTKASTCFCIEPIEASFPETMRTEYRGGGNAAYTGLEYLKTLNKGLNCIASYCQTNLRPSPKGSVPGFW